MSWRIQLITDSSSASGEDVISRFHVTEWNVGAVQAELITNGPQPDQGVSRTSTVVFPVKGATLTR